VVSAASSGPLAVDPLSLFVAAHRDGRGRARGTPRFNAGEHAWLADAGARRGVDAVRARGVAVPPALFDAIARRDGEVLRYGELVALSGDFYETPEALFDERPSPLPWLYEGNDLSDLRRYFADELRWIEARRAGDGEPEYPDFNVRFAWNAKAYVELALRNTDHFGWHNVRAYCRHHEAALDLAGASRGRADEGFRRALYVNAFADHFLTDGFAAGHVRVPRAQIRAWAEEAGHDEKLAGVLSKVLHDQDGHVDLRSMHGEVDENARAPDDGLAVRNAAGDEWTTRCDGQLFLRRGDAGGAAVERAVSAVAASVAELLLAWKGRGVPAGAYAATREVPFPRPGAQTLAGKFPADPSPAAFDALCARVEWYARIPWVGAGFRREHLADFLRALPALMERFRADVAADAVADPALTARIAPEYVDAYRRIG
jgi:hypothetical protein